MPCVRPLTIFGATFVIRLSRAIAAPTRAAARPSRPQARLVRVG